LLDREKQVEDANARIQQLERERLEDEERRRVAAEKKEKVIFLRIFTEDYQKIL
jgi:hypothetical protein